jgi:hypothetical protein
MHAGVGKHRVFSSAGPQAPRPLHLRKPGEKGGGAGTGPIMKITADQRYRRRRR